MIGTNTSTTFMVFMTISIHLNIDTLTTPSSKKNSY